MVARVCFFNPRTATVVLSFLGAVGNFVVATHVFALWRTLKSEPESEWEGSSTLRIDALKIATAVAGVYFTLAALACVVGFIGAAKRISSYVRFFRDLSVADLSFSAFSTIFLAFASFRPSIRSLVCDELSRQPELLRNLAETGLTLENCEAWFERAIVAFIALMAVLLVIRLQFTLAVTSFHSELVREQLRSGYTPLDTYPESFASQRVYLLPPRSSPSSTSGRLVYVPVPVESLLEEDVQRLDGSEAWVSRIQPGPMRPHAHHAHHHHAHSHSHAHSHAHAHAHTRTHGRHGHRRSEGRLGGISLPIGHDEPLLPAYQADLDQPKL